MSETENNELTAGKQSKEPRSNQKLKLLYLAKILLNNTDANHDITLDEILNKLHAYDVTAARKSLYDDIAAELFWYQNQKDAVWQDSSLSGDWQGI